MPGVLAQAGVRFVVVEHLSQSKIDGACLWLDERSPVIAMSVRFDRIDWFWHTVMHEMKHVKNRDGLKAHNPLDTDLVGERVSRLADQPEFEKQADAFASAFLIPLPELRQFIARVGPLYSKIRIQGFARQMGVHPGIVVGQLQFQGEIKYYHNREMLVKVRDILTRSAMTDGWGYIAA